MDQLFVIVALVLQIQNGQSVGSATGFFYTKSDSMYFVTNRHVVLDETRPVKPDTLRLRLHTDSKNLTKNADVDVPLYSNGIAKWHVHPNYTSNNVDVAIVEIDMAKLNPYYFKAFSSSAFLPKDNILGLGEDVMVIGFPRGISDTTHNLPINRGAMISSAYKIDFQGKPQFLVDVDCAPAAGEFSPRLEGSAIGGFGLLK